MLKLGLKSNFLHNVITHIYEAKKLWLLLSHYFFYILIIHSILEFRQKYNKKKIGNRKRSFQNYRKIFLLRLKLKKVKLKVIYLQT